MNIFGVIHVSLLCTCSSVIQRLILCTVIPDYQGHDVRRAQEGQSEGRFLRWQSSPRLCVLSSLQYLRDPYRPRTDYIAKLVSRFRNLKQIFKPELTIHTDDLPDHQRRARHLLPSQLLRLAHRDPYSRIRHQPLGHCRRVFVNRHIRRTR